MCMYGRCVCNTRQCARFVCLRLIHTNVQHFVFNVSFQFVVTVIVAVLFCFVESSSLFWLLVVCCVFLQSYRQGIILCVARLADGTVRIDFSLFQTADSLVSNGMQNLLVAISEQYSFRLFRSLNQSYCNWLAKLWLSILLIC